MAVETMCGQSKIWIGIRDTKLMVKRYRQRERELVYRMVGLMGLNS